MGNATRILAVAILAGFTWGANAAIVQFSGNGHYYQFVNIAVPWSQARSLAQENGGYLATITSLAENNFVASLLPSGVNDAWLGGFQPPGSPEPGGGWQWVTGEPFDYLNWNGGEPNEGVGWGVSDENALEMYGIISVFGSWNDVRGTSVYPFIAEYEESPIPIDPGVIVPEPSTWIAGVLIAAFLGFDCIRRLRRSPSFPDTATLPAITNKSDEPRFNTTDLP